MKCMKQWTGLVLCMAMLASFAACGNKAEDRMIPEDVTEVTTETTDAAAGEETTEETTDTTKETKETQTTEDTTADASDADSTEETKQTTTTAATEAATAAQTETAAAAEAPAANHDTPAPAADPAPAPANDPAPAEPAPVQTPASDITFSVGGVNVDLGASAKAFVGAIACDTSESSPSCLGNGEDIVYHYNGYDLYVWNDNDSYQLVGADISGGGITTNRGIGVGASAEELTAAYGTDYTERNDDFVYDFGGGCSISFTLSDGKVTFISYNKET